jgi:prefoldin subunit 5
MVNRTSSSEASSLSIKPPNINNALQIIIQELQMLTEKMDTLNDRMILMHNELINMQKFMLSFMVSVT